MLGGQIFVGRGLSPRMSVRSLELPSVVKQSHATSNIAITVIRNTSVRRMTVSGVLGNKYAGEFSIGSQREAIRQIMKPEAFEVLTEHTTEINEYQAGLRKGDDKGNTSVTLLEKLMMYKKDYIEKSVLLCETTATRIMESVSKQSRAHNSKTQFVDGEGGLCMLASKAEQMQEQFKSVAVLEKDLGMTPLHSYSRIAGSLSKKAQVHHYQGSLPKIAADNIELRGGFPTPLNDFLPKDSFSEDLPSYTMVLTSTHAVVKYLTHRRLYQADSPLSEFYAARPEFFFIVTPRTFFHMHCGTGPPMGASTRKLSVEEMRENAANMKNQSALMLPNNVAFQLLFDFCLVDVIPRKAFFPWRPLPSNKKVRAAQFEEHKENLMVVYARPKPEKDVDIGVPHHLGYFLSAMLKRKSKPLVATLEAWCPGSGLPVMLAGHNILTLISDLKPHQFYEVYQLFIASPDFASSSFVVQADLWADAQKNPRSSEDSKTRSSEKAKRKEYKRKIKAAMMADTSRQADA